MHKLHLGAAENIQPGWLNTDLHGYGRGDELVYLDVRKRFPLPDASFDFVFSEHMIEHLTYAEGQECLGECFRILRPSGRIRLATPSLQRLAALYSAEPTDLQRRYVDWAVDTLQPEVDLHLPGVVVNNFFRSWGHRFIYDPETLRHALTSAGFVDVQECRVGESSHPDLAGLERHLGELPELNEYETFVLEARRP
jgi:predicted SAM-dependent methyltransferase